MMNTPNNNQNPTTRHDPFANIPAIMADAEQAQAAFNRVASIAEAAVGVPQMTYKRAATMAKRAMMAEYERTGSTRLADEKHDNVLAELLDLAS